MGVSDIGVDIDENERAIGILRVWLAVGAVVVLILAIYIGKQRIYYLRSASRGGRGSFSSGSYHASSNFNYEGGLLIFIIGTIMVIVGFLLLRWVLNAFANRTLNLSIKSILTEYEED